MTTELTTHAAPELPADPMVSMIERIVMDPNASIEKLEKMLEMRERIEAQEARRAYSRAMSAAKSEIGPILKTGRVDYENKTGGRTAFDHETLDGIARAVDPILSKNGLSYRYRSKQADGGLYVTCIVEHRDGHFEETTLHGAPDSSGSKNAYQAVGSAATYLQRYTLKLALGLSAAKDDDGGAAGAKATITADQYLTLRDLIDAAKADEGKFLGWVTERHLHAIGRSAEMRRQRVAAGRGLREEAKRLGISPTRLSALERGEDGEMYG